MLCYTVNNNLLPSFFSSLYTAVLPAKFTFRFLQQLGYKSSAQRDLVYFLKSFGFVDAGGAPTSLYTEYKNSTNPTEFVSVCAKNLYTEIIAISSDFSEPSLLHSFKSAFPNHSHEDITKAVATFKALNKHYKFVQAPSQSNPNVVADINSALPKAKGVNININLPETENEKVYEAIFKYLKNILG